MNNQKLVINIIGYPACGKSSVCAHLAERGFFMQRPSDVIRAFAKAHNIELHSRQDYLNVHLLLNKETPTRIIEPVIASTEKLICLDGLRSPFLLDELQKQPFRTVIIALDCPIEIRFKRMQADDVRRGTHRAPETFEKFQADEQSDYQNSDRNVSNMLEVMSRADFTVDASKSSEAVLTDIDRIIDQLLTPA
jgi:dephospho-CoA kinase